MRRKISQLPALALCLALIVPACTGRRETLRVAIVSLPAESLDPFRVLENGLMYQCAANVYESLLDVDPAGNIVPNLAADYFFDETRTELTLTLPDTVRFHDGSPLRASDAAASLRSAAGLDAGIDQAVHTDVYDLLGRPTAITAPDSLTLRVVLPRPHSPMLRTLAFPVLTPITGPMQEVPGAGPVPVGTGPYRIVRLNHQRDVITLERNPAERATALSFRRVELHAYPGPLAALDALETGTVQIASPVSFSDLNRIRKRPELQLIKGPASTFAMLGLNNQRPPFNEIDNRLAFSRAVDSERILHVVTGGAGRAISGYIGGNLQPHVTSPPAPRFDPDLDPVSLAGITRVCEERPLEIIMLVNEQSDREHLLESFLNVMLRDFGILCTLREYIDTAEFMNQVTAGQWDISFDGVVSDNGDFYSALYTLYLKPSEHGGTGVCGLDLPGLSEPIERALGSVDPAVQSAAYEEALALIAGQVPCIPLGVRRYLLACRDRIEHPPAIPFFYLELADFRRAER